MHVNEADFHETVRRRAALDSDEAAREVTDATLRILGERLSDGEVDDLAPLLPEGVAASMLDAGEGRSAGFPFDEFVARVAERTGATEADARRQARAVGATLAAAVGEEELHDARSQLQDEYDQLFWAVGAEEFVDRVREEADLGSDDEAREAATATLGVLGERITAGEAEAVAAYLPEEFAGALLEPGTPATDLSVDEFAESVADRAGVEPDVARSYVRAVTAALAESIPDYEYRDVLDQLPDDYAPLLGAIVHPDEGERR